MHGTYCTGSENLHDDSLYTDSAPWLADNWLRDHMNWYWIIMEQTMHGANHGTNSAHLLAPVGPH